LSCVCLYMYTVYMYTFKTFLLDKITVPRVNKKFSVVYEQRLLINAFVSSSHLSMNWGMSVHSMSSFSLGSILILFFLLRLGLPSGLYLSELPTEACIHFSFLLCVPYSASNSFFSIWSCGFYLARGTLFTFNDMESPELVRR
jgi:hypothetical protein